MSTIQQLLHPHAKAIAEYLNHDPELQAINKDVGCTFSIISSDDSSKPVLVDVSNNEIRFTTETAQVPSFGLCARPEQWQAFFAERLVRPYQSFWGMLRVLGAQEGVTVVGDQISFGRHARLWRLTLDRIRDAVHGRLVRKTLGEPPADSSVEEDSLVGKYVWLTIKAYGKVKIFYETAGTGPQDLLFLHTAGSDSRQYHCLMNQRELQARCTMYAFDLPAHGRSSLGSQQMIGDYALDEDTYIEVIDKLIKYLNLRSTVVCGASMAGHICLAVATRARELGVRGVIPCEGCEHLPSTQPIYELGGADTSLLDPERVIGMCAPTSSGYHVRQIWWQYSTQGFGVFAGDLKFYFRGWDGRGRMETIDTGLCPVYMLTGEYDYSCTVEASKATAAKIPGAVFEVMRNLGHFPLTEAPGVVMPYLLRAMDYIEAHREED
ncbi:hypothetical protein LTR62_008772 [Meristemomyces frigidus]|uniref:AB hydrolase-1 domain-containing protein n=1 Tax=Meristemomyces frigidus TaxID=1508187 RepID=A0AAN7T9M0_9PEZI|nr:hypothetical protein LTR62_008772 [Meristemomyces frigidus]